jgi:polyisoprenoid-binding protein YceI
MSTWKIDPAHTTVSFSVKHMMITTVRGSFSNASGFVEYDENNPSNATVDAKVDVATVSTNAPDRDAHLRSADFFNAEAHPELRFKSSKVDLSGQNAKVTGDLTIAGVTKPVVFDVAFIGVGKNPFDGTERISFSATTKINREEFGLKWNVALEAGGFLVGSDVKIELDIQGIKATESVPSQTASAQV